MCEIHKSARILGGEIPGGQFARKALGVGGGGFLQPLQGADVAQALLLLELEDGEGGAQSDGIGVLALGDRDGRRLGRYDGGGRWRGHGHGARKVGWGGRTEGRGDSRGGRGGAGGGHDGMCWRAAVGDGGEVGENWSHRGIRRARWSSRAIGVSLGVVGRLHRSGIEDEGGGWGVLLVFIVGSRRTGEANDGAFGEAGAGFVAIQNNLNDGLD